MGSAATITTAKHPAFGDLPDSATRRAVLFPGQGSQREGMARAWHETPHAALWARADEVLGWDVTRLGTSASAEELRDPVHCQVALFVHGAVLFDAWSAAGGVAHIAAGHSLGEYNALLAAGIVTFEGGLRLVEQRALATRAAAEHNPGGMVACLGGDPSFIRDACAAAGVSVANDNAEGQMVIAGDDLALERFTTTMAESRARVIRLEVGAAYHSPAMNAAVEPLIEALTATRFSTGSIPVVANVDGQPHDSADAWPALLAAQLTAPVRWRDTMLRLASAGVEEVVELGASPVLTGLAKRTTPGLRRSCVSEPGDLDAA